MRKTSASVSPPPAATTSHGYRRDSLNVHDMTTLSGGGGGGGFLTHETASQAGTLGAVSMFTSGTTPNTVTFGAGINSSSGAGADPNSILLFDKLLDKIVDGLVVNNER